MRRLFEGGVYLRAASISGNTVYKINIYNTYSVPLNRLYRKLASLAIITSKMQASGERATEAAADLYAQSLSRLRLRVARLYLHCGISHWADI